MTATTPVIAFALLRQCSEMMRTDLLSGIAILMRPLISDLADQIFDSRVLSERLSNAYGISIPPTALDGMVSRLVSANVLRVEETKTGLPRALYCSAQEVKDFELEVEADFQAILDSFLCMPESD